ncbi:MAG: hypothetical protein JOZ15_05735 [Acidobacteria bacterium]|nr:hypothetical protein [Acidobacteriota bacterium]
MNANVPRGRTADAKTCRRVRDQLCQPAAAGSASGVTGHLASCPDCAAFARRLELAREALRRPPGAPAMPVNLENPELPVNLDNPANPVNPVNPANPENPENIEPDPYFAQRVLARLARPADLLGWAAFRTLPAALGLALALAGLGWLGLPAVTAAPASPLLDEPPSSDQLLTWSSLSPEIWP